MPEPLWGLFEVDQQRITALDTSIVAIRGWAITLDSALAGFAVSQHSRAFLLVAVNFANMAINLIDHDSPGSMVALRRGNLHLGPDRP